MKVKNLIISLCGFVLSMSACLPDEECELFENRPSAHKNLREFIDWGFVFGPRTVRPETPETNAIINQCSLER